MGARACDLNDGRDFAVQKGARALSGANEAEHEESDEGGLARKTKLVQQFRSTVALVSRVLYIQGVSKSRRRIIPGRPLVNLIPPRAKFAAEPPSDSQFSFSRYANIACA